MKNFESEINVFGKPLFCMMMDDILVSFDVSYVPEQDREWFRGVVSKTLLEIRERSFRLGQLSVRQSIRKELGLE